MTSAAYAPASSASDADALDLVGGVAGEAVDRDDRVDPELAHDADVAGEVGGARLDRLDAAVRIAGVVLQRLHGRDEHTASGRSLPARQTMWKNFSIPMSEPKPLSVTT